MKQIVSNFKRCFLNLSRNKRLYSNFQASLREKDGLLFTPGPLKTTMTVKQAMLHDWGSRDLKMINLINNVRSEILNLANVSSKDYTTILMQGSGTFSVEATITSTIPPNGKILVISNGAYGKRGAKIAKTANINCVTLNNPENQIPNVDKINQTLANDPSFTHVLCIHSETTSGIVNPVEEIGKFVNLHKKKYIVDAMSSFGAIPINLYKGDVDYLISSSNKNIQGVPGFAFVIAKKKSIQKTEGLARSVSLDLYSQLLGLDHDGQFRFTPPTHSLIAFQQALEELKIEGGILARKSRYEKNQEICIKRMKKIGFKTYVQKELMGPIITSFHYPNSKNWNFKKFYNLLSNKKFIIYPGKVSNADCFRIGHIGHIYPNDTENLMNEIEKICKEMNIFN